MEYVWNAIKKPALRRSKSTPKSRPDEKNRDFRLNRSFNDKLRQGWYNELLLSHFRSFALTVDANDSLCAVRAGEGKYLSRLQLDSSRDMGCLVIGLWPCLIG